MPKPRRLEVWRYRRGQLVMNVQSDLLGIDTFVVVPLVRVGNVQPTETINPVIEVDGQPYLLLAQQISAVRANDLREAVAYLPETEGVVVRALDRLLTTS
jgi:toxin CcdB